jgi:predicted acylesterase/phospholipase RssA
MSQSKSTARRADKIMISRNLGFYTALIVFLVGCKTKSNSASEFEKSFQTPPWSVASYQSAELRSQSQNTNLSVVVAISGGGHRAGNFAIGVLSELESLTDSAGSRNVLGEVDVFSTVSGGGLAAAVFVSTLFDHKTADSSAPYSLRQTLAMDDGRMLKNLRRSYHTSVLRAVLNPKARGVTDRGDFLEEAFDDRLLGYKNRGRSLTLGDLFVPVGDKTRRPLVPLWVANATVYENGSVFPFHPLGLEKYEIVSFYSLPLAVGMKASASFPTLLPATTLESSFDSANRFLHLYDGGLSDNLGIYTAVDILGETAQRRKVLLVIDAYKGNSGPFSKSEGSPKFLQIGIRTTSISLDAGHIRHRRMVARLIAGYRRGGSKIDVVYLGFDDLPDPRRKEVRDIQTDFKISEKEQQILFEAAKEVVALKRDRIRKLVLE